MSTCLISLFRSEPQTGKNTSHLLFEACWQVSNHPASIINDLMAFEKRRKTLLSKQKELKKVILSKNINNILALLTFIFFNEILVPIK